MKRLLLRRKRILRDLPSLEEAIRGSVVERRLRCGKPACWCAQGDGHPATYLCVTLAPGRAEQISLPAKLAPLARLWVANYTAWREALEQISQINREWLRRLRKQDRARVAATNLRARRRRRP